MAGEHAQESTEKREKESPSTAAVLEQKGNGINICRMMEDIGFMP
jgi:hypothetical protein